MPRKTKEQIESENKENEVKKATVKKASTNKKTAKSKEEKPVKKETKSTTKKTTTAKKKSATSTTSKKESTKKTVAKKAATKKTTSSTKTSAKKTTKKSTTRKTTARKKSVKKQVKIEPVEYYDLPYRYNQTVVKVLAQTPTTLFIYWDISDNDRKKYEEEFGEDFFQNSKPVLIVYNDTLGYKFEVEINDFANSWYLHVADSKCDYRIELGRRPIVKNEKLKNDYIYVATSNEMESPNDRILFNKEQKMVYYKNVKTGAVTEKPINTLSFITNMGKIYDIYDLYKEMYQNEDVKEIYDLKNPSSHPSS